MKTLKRTKIVTFIYAVLTLLTHLTVLFLAIYRLIAVEQKKAVSQTLLSLADELLSYGFVYLCFGFMIIAAILLIAGRICVVEYLRLHEIFWLTQFTGYWIFRLIMKLITEYAKMDLYWRFIKVFSYDMTPCLIWLPVLICLGMNYGKNRKNRELDEMLRFYDNVNKSEIKNPKNRIFQFVTPAILIIIFLIYYFTFYGAMWISDAGMLTFGDRIYKVISPFSIAPIIIELFFLVILIFYSSLILKIIFAAMYMVSIFFSLVAIMGYTSIWDFRFYTIQVVLLAAVIVPKIIAIKGSRIKR